MTALPCGCTGKKSPRTRETKSKLFILSVDCIDILLLCRGTVWGKAQQSEYITMTAINGFVVLFSINLLAFYGQLAFYSQLGCASLTMGDVLNEQGTGYEYSILIKLKMDPVI